MKISIVVPSYNGANKVGRLIDSLKVQTFKDFELIVVVDGSTDSTIEKINSMEINHPVEILFQKNSGRSASRNNGVNKAKGDLICFFDDDIILEKNCLQRHYDYHSEFPGSIIVGPTIEDPKSKNTDFQKYKCNINRETIQVLSQITEPMRMDNLFVTAANLSMSKKTFFEVGGFDERLPDSEDYEFGFRALTKKHKIYFRSDVLVNHEEFITCQSYIKRQREYLKGQQILMGISPSADKYSREKSKNQSDIKELIYGLFSRKIVVSLIDKFNIFTILPVQLRYRFYSLVIWGLGTKYPYREI